MREGSAHDAENVIVLEATLEDQLAFVRSAAADRQTGIFAPDSVTWRIDREAAIFLGAGRALLLQLAHPWVAAAIAQHSRSLTDPIGRFQRTFSFVFTMVFGTTEEAAAAARRLHRRHARIDGVLTESAGAFAAGSRYRANDIRALRWVHATLTESALIAYQLVNPPLSIEDCERYYAEARLFAALFGIPQSAMPQSWAGFAKYVDTMLASDVLVVSGAARGIADELFFGSGNGVAYTALVSGCDRAPAAGAPAQRLWIAVQAFGALLSRAGAQIFSLRLSLAASPSTLCRALP